MNVELTMLVCSALLMLVLPLLYGPGFIGAVGSARMVGNREDVPPVEGWFARAKRAHANLGENLPAFAVMVLTAQALGVHTGWTQGGAVLFLVARVLHALCYIAGIGPARSAAYVAGVVGTVMVAGPVISRLLGG